MKSVENETLLKLVNRLVDCCEFREVRINGVWCMWINIQTAGEGMYWQLVRPDDSDTFAMTLITLASYVQGGDKEKIETHVKKLKKIERSASIGIRNRS